MMTMAHRLAHPTFTVAGNLLGMLLLLTGCGHEYRPRLDGSVTDAPGGEEVGGVEAGGVDRPACPPSCDDDSPCTIDSCDLTTFACAHTPVPDGTSCQGKPCATNAICMQGLCLDGPNKKCVASDQCHVAGTCDPRTGECTDPMAPSTTPCDDGDSCTLSDRCANGQCKGTPLTCRSSNVFCDPATSTCPGEFPTPLAAWVFANLRAPENANGVLRDQAGNLYLGGSFYDTLDLGAGPVVTGERRGGSNPDIFLAQMDPLTGKAKWTKSWGSPGVQQVAAFAVTGAGQLGVVGALLEGFIAVAGNEVERVRTGDQYILSASARDGAGLWARRVNLQSGLTDSRAGLRSIAGAPQGSSFTVCGNVVCGKIAAVDGGPIPAPPAKDFSPALTCQGGEDVVIAGLDGATGATLWAEQLGGTNDEDCAAVAMDGQGSAYVVGTYRFGSELRFGALPTLPILDQTRGAVWVYLAKRMAAGPVDAGAADAGHWAWAQSIGAGKQAITPQALLPLATPSGSDLVLAGRIDGTSTAILGVDVKAVAFVARLDGETGSLKWIQGLGDGTDMNVSAMAEAGDRIQLAGSYLASCVMGPAVLPEPHPSGGAFVAHLDAQTGAVVAARGYGYPLAGNGGLGVAVRTEAVGDEQNTSLVLFTFSGQMDLGSPLGVVTGTSATGSATSSCLAKLAH